MTSLKTIQITGWEEDISPSIQEEAVQALETGKVLYFPNLAFVLNQTEKSFLSPSQIHPKSKNISYDLKTDHLAGASLTGAEARPLKEMIQRYSLSSRRFLERLIPFYASHLVQGKTSFRPIEISGRKTSYRKDDTRLHVDSFPSNPTQGKRILRFFTNINPDGKARMWKTGEPFLNVAKRFTHKISKPFPGFAQLLHVLKITKNLRSPYDHYMLHIHDQMKADLSYQQTAHQENIFFPPGSSWMVYTDQVSHAALSGQHVLEQTFHFPFHGLKYQEAAPLKQLENILNRTLV